MNNTVKIIFGVFFICLGALTGLAGVLFRIMHWPGSALASYLSPPFLVAGLAFLLTLKKKKDQ